MPGAGQNAEQAQAFDFIVGVKPAVGVGPVGRNRVIALLPGADQMDRESSALGREVNRVPKVQWKSVVTNMRQKTNNNMQTSIGILLTTNKQQDDVLLSIYTITRQVIDKAKTMEETLVPMAGLPLTPSPRIQPVVTVSVICALVSPAGVLSVGRAAWQLRAKGVDS